jgi:hypothetical protein
MVFYDALMCNGSVWVPLATTDCPVEDAGPPEASDEGG